MTVDPVDLIARTVLYEGYLLYPYRPSALKNRQRFTFGVLYPEACCDPAGHDRWQFTMECPLRGSPETRVAISVRFLQLVERRAAEGPLEGWHDAIERRVDVDLGTVAHLQEHKERCVFGFPRPDVADSEDVVVGELVAGAESVQPGAYKLSVGVGNRAVVAHGLSRHAALERSLASAHAVIGVTGGELVSLLDPPDDLRGLARSCTNQGVWPVLVGDAPCADRMLASPIILYDRPQVAPESIGDLFDGTEIDEILALRVLTMTDDEKREARVSDDRARQIVDRAERLGADDWARLHGILRSRKAIPAETP
jgi:hypothetical protein